MFIHLCESCIHGEITVNEQTKYHNYPYGAYQATSMNTWCKLTWRNKRLIIMKCKGYFLKPDYPIPVIIDGKKTKIRQVRL